MVADEQTTPPEPLLLSTGSDNRVRVWKTDDGGDGDEGAPGGLRELGLFGAQAAPVVALAQNSTHLASAAGDARGNRVTGSQRQPSLIFFLFFFFKQKSEHNLFAIALWLLSDLALDPCMDPQIYLHGHTGGVTCLAFSPDGAQLLSGAKDQVRLLRWTPEPVPCL